ncbi:unnamed protein product [Boreogadus saida]
MFQSVPWYSDEDRCVLLVGRKNPHIFLLAFLLREPWRHLVGYSSSLDDTLELYKVKKVTCSLSQGVCLLTKSKTSSPRARPPPPHPEQDLHLLTQSQTSTSCQKSSSTAESEAERLGTGGLWCQGGPETEAGDQPQGVTIQRESMSGGAVLMEEPC